MKKTMSLLLVLALVMTLFAGCGGETAQKQEEENLPEKMVTSAECSESETVQKQEEKNPLEEMPTSEEEDYLRAFAMGYVDETYRTHAVDRQVTSQEYKIMLKSMLADFECEDTTWFEGKVTDYDVPLSRGGAITMSYYAAVCMGADNYNNKFNHELASADGKFWDTEGMDFDRLFPDCYSDIPVEVDGQTWANEFTASFLWNVWHSSPYSGQQTVPFDEAAGGMRNGDPFTVEQAICAVARLADSFGKEVFVPVDAEVAVHMDQSVWTEDLADKAKASQIQSVEELPRLTGFVLHGAYSGYHTNTIDKSENDIRNIAQWGFSSARFQMRYETIFTDDCTSVNLTQLKKLDKLVAAAVENDLHLNLLLVTLPGRTIWSDMEEFESGGVFDLFVNEKQQEKAKLVWQILAQRYRDVPGEYLSFTPFWEPDGDLSTGAGTPEYDAEDICRSLDKLVNGIREVDPDRFIIYEPHDGNDADTAIKASEDSYEMMEEKYENSMISYNFCQNVYVFAEMTAEEGVNIDHNNHGMFKPEYPVTIYTAKSSITSGEEIVLDGCLPAGTTLELHLKSMKGSGFFTISADQEVLHTEPLRKVVFETGYKLSQWYPFANSDKKISVTLEQDAEKIVLACENGSIEWSGMNVILPEEYAMEKWYYKSAYDVYLEGGDKNLHEGHELKTTSTIMICPNSEEDGKHITIHENLTYTSEEIWQQANAQTIGDWGAAISAFSPQCLVRIENDSFNVGTSQDSLLRYYEDVYSMLDQYDMNWYSNDYDVILGQSTSMVAGARTERNGVYFEFNREILELLQKHQ